MPDLTLNFLFMPIWAWIVTAVAIILFSVYLARNFEFEGVNITAMPPFLQFRFKRKQKETVSPHSAPSPTTPSINPPPPAPVSPAPPRPSLPIFNLPHRRNPNFTGREEELKQLHDALTANPSTEFTLTKEGLRAAALTQPQAIHGLGGLGKTQLAVEYVYRHKDQYEIVWWVRAEEPATLASDYARLAQELDLREKDATDQRIVIDAVKRELQARDKWLLIFDNATDQESVYAYLPQSDRGNVIITSRNPAWRGIATPLAVQVLPRAESIAFLLKRTGKDVIASPKGAKQSPSNTETLAPHATTVPEAKRSGGAGVASQKTLAMTSGAMTEAANKIAAALGDLPLALEQAGAFVEAESTSLAEYLALYTTRRAELLKKNKPLDYPDSVMTTWDLSFQRAAKASPAALALMNLLAFFAPDDIPRDLLRGGARHLPEPLKSIASDDYEWTRAEGALARYSFIRSVDSLTLSVHRLVQAAARDRMDNDAKKEWAEAAAKIVNDAFPYDSDDVRTWDACARLLAHALATAENATALGIATNATARLFNQAALYLQVRAQFNEAKQLFERALTIDEAAFGPNHPNVATDVNNLGSVLKALGDLDGARKHFERALAIDEAAFGPNHPNVAIRVNNLGAVLQDLGDLDSARKHYERVIKIFEDNLGANHPNVATAVNNLGLVLKDLGDLDGARKHLERALAIDEAAFGPNHPNVARDVNNLGMVLQARGDLDGARKHYERALKIFTDLLGENHPNTVKVRKNLEALKQRMKAEG